MKKRAILAGLILVLAVMLMLEGCGLFGVTTEQRISFFLDDLNQSPRPDSIRFNFSTSCQDYDQITGLTFGQFDEFPWESIPYTLNIPNYDVNPVTGTISGKAGGTFGAAALDIEFTMIKEGYDWYILELVLVTNVIVQ